MKIKEIKARLGILRTPKYSARFAANHPVNGTFYGVHFSDGLYGLVCDRRNGTYIPQCALLKRYKGKTFVDFQDAADALYAGLVVYGDPFSKKDGKKKED